MSVGVRFTVRARFRDRIRVMARIRLGLVRGRVG